MKTNCKLRGATSPPVLNCVLTRTHLESQPLTPFFFFRGEIYLNYVIFIWIFFFSSFLRIKASRWNDSPQNKNNKSSHAKSKSFETLICVFIFFYSKKSGVNFVFAGYYLKLFNSCSEWKAFPFTVAPVNRSPSLQTGPVLIELGSLDFICAQKPFKDKTSGSLIIRGARIFLFPLYLYFFWVVRGGERKVTAAETRRPCGLLLTLNALQSI